MKEEESINDLARSRQENTELSEEALKQYSVRLEEPEPEVKETLEILDKEVGTSERIINSLLDFARPKAPTRRKVEIRDNVMEALSRTTVPENVELVSELEEALPVILADPEWVSVSFTDTGLGIQEENLKRVFEPLFTSKAKGIGLGLAVTRTLVEGHCGSIEAQSEHGKGTTFSVRRPTGNRKGE